MTRAFFAIGLDDHIRETLVRACDAFRDEAPAWKSEKWVAPENLHLTLAFLGDVPDSTLRTLAEHARAAIGTQPAFRLGLGDVRAVPRPRAATMLWCTIAAGELEAAQLATTVSEAAAAHGITLPSRPFAAHITLARTRHPRPAPAQALAAAAEALASARAADGMSVQGVMLCSSTLTPRGPLYSTIARLPLLRD